MGRPAGAEYLNLSPGVLVVAGSSATLATFRHLLLATGEGR